MSRPPYPYNKNLDTRYTFISRGKRDIEKVVDFTQTSIENLFNLGFGDLLPAMAHNLRKIQLQNVKQRA